jgi:hypothetical protein
MKKQLLKFGLMAGMGAFVLAQGYAKDVKSFNNNAASDTVAMRDTVNALDTASFYRDTVSMNKDTASFALDTANFVRDTASFSKDTASFAHDTASFANDTASFVRDTALLNDTAFAALKADTATFKTADTATSNFARKLDAAMGDTSAMKVDTAAFRKDTATIVKQDTTSLSIRKDTTVVPADTTKVPKPKKAKK